MDNCRPTLDVRKEISHVAATAAQSITLQNKRSSEAVAGPHCSKSSDLAVPGEDTNLNTIDVRTTFPFQPAS
jgi:hypothetical protein